MISIIGSSGFKEAKAESEEIHRLEEIVVTATKTEKTLLDAPQSVSVITSGDIEESMAQDAGDILRELPGVEISSGPRAIGENPVIRGLSGARLQLRLDDARMNALYGHTTRLFLNIDDIERIEVLRGAGSALYGSDAIGGVINIYTKDPKDLLAEDEHFGVSLRGGFNSVNEEYRGTTRLFGRTGGAFEYLLSFTDWDTDDQIKLSDGSKLSDSEQSGYGVSAKLIFHPTDSASLTFDYNLYDEDSRSPGNPANPTTTRNILRDRNIERQLVKLGFSHKADEGLWTDFKADIYYQTYKLFTERLAGSAKGRKDFRDLDAFGLEVRNSHILDLADTFHHLTYGLEYYRDETSGKRINPDGSRVDIGSFPAGDAYGLGLYLQNEIGLFDERLTLIPGLRWDKFKATAEGQPDKEEDRFSPKIAAVYKVNEEVRLFTNFGLGFRMPRLSELFVSGTHFPGNVFVPNPGLISEKSRNFELGFRANWERLSLESVYFLTHAKDFIRSKVTRFETTRDNVDEVEIWGLENSLDFDLGGGFSTFASFVLQRGKDTKANEHLGSIAPDTLGLGLRYRNIARTFSGSLSARFVDEQKRVEDEADRTSGYAVFDLKMSYTLPELGGITWLEGLRLDFGIENIFDKKHREHLSGLYAPARILWWEYLRRLGGKIPFLPRECA